MLRKSSKLLVAAAGVFAFGLAGISQADDQDDSVGTQGTVIKSRGADSAHADLMRDWDYKSADQGKRVTLRTDAELNADLMRDWDGPAKSGAVQTRQAPHSRTSESAYDDLIRNWGG
jgi:hypothetical protein